MNAPPNRSGVRPLRHTDGPFGRWRWLAGELGQRHMGRRAQGVAALVLYVMASLLLLGRDAVGDPAHTCVCDGGPDSTAYMWGLVWWPHAVVHGLNPFVTHAIWTPQGTNLAASAALLPGPSLLLAPVTSLFGPIAAYNVLSLLGPVLAAWFAFHLCRYVTKRWLPSVIGGYVFGFSSYELGQLLGHPNLAWIFLVPAAVHLTLLSINREVSGRRFVVLMALILAFQVLVSTEVLVTMLTFGVAALALAYWFVPDRRREITEFVPRLLVAGVAAAVVVSPYLYYALKAHSQLPWHLIVDQYSADPLNYVLPTPVTWLGHQQVAAVANTYNSLDGGTHGNVSESGAYLGLPLLAIVVWYLVAERRRPHAKVLLAVLVVLFVASLGPHLHVAQPPKTTAASVTYQPSIPLPWRVLEGVPGLNRAQPVRFSMYVFLAGGLIVALWLAQARSSWRRWLLAGAGVVALLPSFSAAYWRGHLADPKFFSSSLYKSYIRPGETALVFPYGYNGNSMLWQARTHMYFKMAGGYAGQEIPSSYARDPLVTTSFLNPLSGTAPMQRLGDAMRRFIRRRRVGVVIDASPGADAWQFALASQGLHPIRVGGVLVYAVPKAWLRIGPF